MNRKTCVLILCVACAALAIGWSRKASRAKAPSVTVWDSQTERKSLVKSKAPPPPIIEQP